MEKKSVKFLFFNDQGKATVTGKSSCKTAVIEVTDNGIGFPEGINNQSKKSIFEKGVGKNTGLEFFLLRDILSITGLDIHETGAEGKGSRLVITVPHVS